MKTINSLIKTIDPLTETVFRVILEPEKPIDFLAGQYINVLLSEKDKRAFSFASIPGEKEIELHLGAALPNAYALSTVNYLQNNPTVMLQGPNGDAWLRPGDRPLLLIAGGTGYSYTLSILREALRTEPKREIMLYWGGKQAQHLYDLAFLEDLSLKHSNLNIVPVIEDNSGQEQWNGKQGKVIDSILDDYQDLSSFDIYMAGRFEMSGIARKRFIQERNALIQHMYSDAFAYI